MAAAEAAKSVYNAHTDHGDEIRVAARAGPRFQSAATLHSQGAPAAGASREGVILSPRFRSAAAMAGWDEEALLVASLVVEDTPVRELKDKKRSEAHHKSPPTTTNSRRKRRSRRRTPPPIPPVTLSLDDEEDAGEVIPALEVKKTEEEATGISEEKRKESRGDPPEKGNAAPATAIPCLDRLREELSCAICLDICFEPSTTPCGHSFCKKCLKCAATKCGKRCPKCRELISNGRACTVNTVLWNTIQLLFPEEIEARKKASLANSCAHQPRRQSPERGSTNSVDGSSARNPSNRINSIRRATRAATLMEGDREMRRMVAPVQSEDAALALRLQREEFMEAFTETQQPQRSRVYLARANLRAMASRAIQLRTRRTS